MHVLEHSTCNLEKKTLTISAKNVCVFVCIICTCVCVCVCACACVCEHDIVFVCVHVCMFVYM